jgi:hypothetical protein
MWGTKAQRCKISDMTYKTSLDGTAKTITVGVTVLFAIFIFGQNTLIRQDKVSIYTSIFLILIYGVAFILRPIHYELSGDSLTIHRLFGDVKIDRINIKCVELADKKKTSRAVRIFGVGGLFGYFGKFANSRLGFMTWYATRRDRTVLIETMDNKKIIVTPNEPEKFVSSFRF